MRRASDWELRIMHERQTWEDNSFITLTYAPGHLPPNSSLEHRDFQLFLKRLRKDRTGKVIRYYMCGEYGPLNQRPHYHACIFNEGFRDDRKPAGKSASGELYYSSKRLDDLWTHGRTSVQDLTRETASYCARYIMKKQLGESAKTAYETITEDGEIIQRQPEYNAMSLKPGIGADWLKKYEKDVYNNDYVIQNGQKRTPPRYYDKLLKRKEFDKHETLTETRVTRAKAHYLDNTDDRLAVRETVEKARISKLNRTLES
ncbi:MAG: replication initiator protein [Microvirus sp.]|nr:MAG: replication initiator protein [Microvirus sp.]